MKFLVQAHTVQQGAEIQMLRALLAEAGIECLIRNESLTVAMGEIPVSECFPELWILNDSDYSGAAAIIAEWRSCDAAEAAPWVCPSCGESIDGQFGACWKCGGEAPDQADAVATSRTAQWHSAFRGLGLPSASPASWVRGACALRQNRARQRVSRSSMGDGRSAGR